MLTAAVASIGLRFGSGAWGIEQAILLYWIIACGLLGAVVMMVLFFVTNDSPSKPAGPVAAAPGGIANTGEMHDSPISASSGNTYVGTDAIKAALEHERAMAGAAKPSPADRSNETNNPIVFELSHRTAHMLYDSESGCWLECQPKSSWRCKGVLLFEVVRSVPPPGRGPGIRPVEVVGFLKFSYGPNTTSVSRPYWARRKHYQVEFDVAHQELLLVGAIKNAAFASYSNPRIGDLPEDHFYVPYRQLGPPTIMPQVPMKLEISLIDANRSTTLLQRRFDLSFVGETIHVGASLEA